MQKTKKGSWTQISIITMVICFCIGISCALSETKKTPKLWSFRPQDVNKITAQEWKELADRHAQRFKTPYPLLAK